MRIFLALVFVGILAASAFAGEYVTVTKNADGSYTVAPTAKGAAVLAEMEEREGANSLELNTHNLLRVWDRRIRESARAQAVEELRDNGGVITPKVKELLEKARGK